jgi:hypothetical protein
MLHADIQMTVSSMPATKRLIRVLRWGMVSCIKIPFTDGHVQVMTNFTSDNRVLLSPSLSEKDTSFLMLVSVCGGKLHYAGKSV